MSDHGVVALGGVGGHIDMRSSRHKARAVFVDQVHIIEQVEQLRLRLIHRGRSRHHDRGAAMHRHLGLGLFQRHQIISVRYLPTNCRSHDIRPVEPVDPGIAGI